MELRSHAGGAVEVAFDHDNGDVSWKPTSLQKFAALLIKDIGPVLSH
jgi:hypothetical protein